MLHQSERPPPVQHGLQMKIQLLPCVVLNHCDRYRFRNSGQYQAGHRATQEDPPLAGAVLWAIRLTSGCFISVCCDVCRLCLFSVCDQLRSTRRSAVHSVCLSVSRYCMHLAHTRPSGCAPYASLNRGLDTTIYALYVDYRPSQYVAWCH